MYKGKYTKEFLEPVVKKSTSFTDVVRNLGLKTNQGNFKNISHKIKYWEISTDHFIRNAIRGRTAEGSQLIRDVMKQNRRPNKEIFIKNSPICDGRIIRKRLLELGWKYECDKCKIGPEWDGEKLVLQVDHIDGNSNDNRFENLRFLCPNCHSQTKTFAGNRNKIYGNRNKIYGNCLDCEKKIFKKSTRCRQCDSKFRIGKKSKIDWPDEEYLKQRSKEIGFLALGRELGVSDNAIRKRIKICKGS